LPAWNRLFSLLRAEVTFGTNTRNTIIIQTVVASLAWRAEGYISSTGAGVVEGFRTPDRELDASRAIVT
jgi:hypothetical protein